MSERLEEIKKMISNQRDFIKELGAHDAEWLIKQAELAEQLEEENMQLYKKIFELMKDNRDWYKQAESFQKENQRYKQALELIYKDTFYESEHDLVSPIHVIKKRAEKALEGDK